MSKNQEAKRRKQDFLRSFFDKSGYQEKEVNGFWLVKQGGGNEIVAIYTKEAFENYKKYNEKKTPLSTEIEKPKC